MAKVASSANSDATNEEVVTARHIEERDIRRSLSRSALIDEGNLIDASAKIDAYFSENPEAMPKGLVSPLVFEYNHVRGTDGGYDIGAKQRVIFVTVRGLMTTMSNGSVQVYAGGATTTKGAALTILHEYGHHSEAALSARSGRVFQTRTAEIRADRWAKDIYKEIFK
ncbi:hypothetical protein [Microbulbifer aestuariivivens]|uniref:hypothetical protein n=1 Tax=Microbulbifer aestuariivivens TaxID=1908308 RepID=UPI0031E506C5